MAFIELLLTEEEARIVRDALTEYTQGLQRGPDGKLLDREQLSPGRLRIIAVGKILRDGVADDLRKLV